MDEAAGHGEDLAAQRGRGGPFQVGHEHRHLQQAYGHTISLDAYQIQPDQIAQQLHAAGLPVHARVVRDPDGQETVPQAYLLASKRSAAPS